MDGLSICGNIASILSLVVTIVVAIRVKEIETGFLRVARLPELTQTLDTHASNLKECYDQFDSSHDITREEIARTVGTLRAIVKIVDSENRQHAKELLRSVEHYNVTGEGHEGLYTTYLSIVKLAHGLRLTQEDEKWKKR